MQSSFGQKEMQNQCFHSAYTLSHELSLNITKYCKILCPTSMLQFCCPTLFKNNLLTPVSTACSLSLLPPVHQFAQSRWKQGPSGDVPSSRRPPHRWSHSRPPPPGSLWARPACTGRAPSGSPSPSRPRPPPLRGGWNRKAGEGWLERAL